MTADLVAFLRARLDEDEQAAKRVHQPYRLYACDDGHVEEPMLIDDPYGDRNGEYQQWGDGEDRLPNHHNSWALIYDPARALAEVDAKRRILDSHYDYRGICTRCFDWQNKPVEREPFPCEVVRLLAAPHATHKDYREEWRP